MSKKNIILKKIIFNTLGCLKLRTKTLEDVLILTSSRSGSTWLTESLQNTNEFKLYNQPFDRVLNRSVYDNLLPGNKNNPYFLNLNKKEIDKLKNYWSKIIDGKINPNVDWKIYKRDFNFFYKRKLIKSFFTKDLIEFYTSQSNLKIIYLIRNPINRAISNIHYGYKDFGDVLLTNKKLIASELIKTESLETIYRQTSSPISKQVIAWYLENFIIYKYLYSTQNNVFILKYEDMVYKNNTELKISQFIFEGQQFQLSKKASKTTQTSCKKFENLSVNKEEMKAIVACLPDFMPYLDELN